jgi:hypothetical protein
VGERTRSLLGSRRADHGGSDNGYDDSFDNERENQVPVPRPFGLISTRLCQHGAEWLRWISESGKFNNFDSLDDFGGDSDGSYNVGFSGELEYQRARDLASELR